MMRAIPLAVASVAVLALAAGQAEAAKTFYSDRVSFDAAAGSLSGFESFESGFSPSASIDFGAFTVTETGDTFNTLISSVSNPTDGSRSLSFEPTDAGSMVTYAFDAPISAFGFDIALGNIDGPSTVTVGGDLSTTFDIPNRNDPVFFGVIDDAGTFDTLTFNPDVALGPGISGEVAMDSVSFGTASVVAVPEPCSLLLLGVGAVVMAAGRVRRRRVRR